MQGKEKIPAKYPRVKLNNESENLPKEKILMKIDPDINLFNCQKAGNSDSEN